jgi:hypothetical protein
MFSVEDVIWLLNGSRGDKEKGGVARFVILYDMTVGSTAFRGPLNG